MPPSPRPSVTNTFFQPAISYLSRGRTPSPHHKRSDSLDSDGAPLSRQASNSHPASVPNHDGSIPLITFSRSPSPYPRSRSSAAASEDEDDDFGDIPPATPLFRQGRGRWGERRSWKGWLRNGGFGAWLFGSWGGWQVYVGFLVVFVGGTGFELVMLNRIILWTGVYKFPYPLTTTLFQFAFTHVLLLLMASLTRVLASPLRSLGLGAAVAPSSSSGSTSGPSGLKGAFHVPRLAGKIRHCVLGGSGIAGGGLLEFEWRKAKAVLPLAVIYVAKIMLSNLSFAYAVYPIYILSRFAIIPLILVLTTFMNRETHSTSILTASLAAALSLEMASSRPGRVTWEAIVAGIASSIFAALYPVLIERTQRSLTSSLIPEGDLPSSSAQDSSSYDNPYRSNLFDDQSGTKEESRAYWQLLHYTSLLSLVILGALELISGEPFEIRHNCYFMDVPWFWFLILMSSLGAWSVFFATPLLIKATGPLSATFLSVPRGALQLVVLSSGKMPAHSWIGVSFCWAASLWFAAVRRYEGRILERIRLEGR